MGGEYLASGLRHTERQTLAAVLRIDRGVAQKRHRLIDGSIFTLGSGADCDLTLGDPQFPELFAYIVHVRGEYRLRCLSAEPILTINGEDTVGAALNHGDRIRCGPYEFRFNRIAHNQVCPSEMVAAANEPPPGSRWVATDRQDQQAIAASLSLIRDIQHLISGDRQLQPGLRRSA